jgi:PhzF family phenazine biosynthesis protein
MSHNKEDTRMTLQLFQVDAFTNEVFKGNPAAVCLLAQPMPEAWMLSLTQEMNLSETAFVLPQKDGFSLRWFTPKVEVNLCGHATLASAHVLFENGLVLEEEPVRFFTRSGELLARRIPNGIELDFPAQPPQPTPPPPQALLEALGVSQPVNVLAFGNKYLIEVASETQVRALQPDFSAMLRATDFGACVTARAEAHGGYDFVSRFFAPSVGINEDPVTGSAHTMLGPYWAAKLGKTDLRAYQASARGGSLGVRVTPQRVYLSGQAVTVFKGTLALQG